MGSRISEFFTPLSQEETLSRMSALESRGDIAGAVGLGERFVERNQSNSLGVRIELVRLHTLSGDLESAMRFMPSDSKKVFLGGEEVSSAHDSSPQASVSDRKVEASVGSVRARVGD